MADLISENLDVNQQLVQTDILNSTPYLEDYLFKIFTDLQAINSELVAGAVSDGANVGTGAEVFQEKDGSVLEFRTLVSADGSVTITEGVDEIDLAASISGSVANSILTYNTVASEYTEFDQFLISFSGGVTTMQFEDSIGVAVTGITVDGDAEVALFYDAAEVVNTRAAADGGLFVNNTSTGAGFERVLTTSDAGGGGATVNAGTVEDSILHWNAVSSEWDELAELTMNVAANVLTMSVEDSGAALQPVLDADADGALQGYFDGSAMFRTVASASGGLEVNNTSTGAGFERVLTTSDAGGGGLTQFQDDGLFGEALYDTDVVFRTNAGGVDIADTSGGDAVLGFYEDGTWGTRRAFIQSNNITGLFIRSERVSNNTWIQATDSSSVAHSGVVVDPDLEVALYFDGDVTMETQAQGIHLVDAAGNDPFMGAYDSGGTGGTRLGFLQWNSTASRLRSERNSLHWEFIAADSVGTAHTGIELDPDGAVTLEFDGADIFRTEGQGIGVATDGTLSDDPAITFYDDDDFLTSVGLIRNHNTLGFEMRNGRTSQTVNFEGTDSGAALTQLINCDPDDAVDLFFDGGLSLSTTAQGIQVENNSGAGNTVLEITGNASTNPSINMEVQTLTKFQLQYLNDTSDTVRFRLVDAGDIFLFSEDTAGTLLEFSDAGFGFNGATPIAAPNYTITNPTTNRSIDVSTITLGNLAQVVGTMIQDLIDYGLYQ